MLGNLGHNEGEANIVALGFHSALIGSLADCVLALRRDSHGFLQQTGRAGRSFDPARSDHGTAQG